MNCPGVPTGAPLFSTQFVPYALIHVGGSGLGPQTNQHTITTPHQLGPKFKGGLYISTLPRTKKIERNKKRNTLDDAGLIRTDAPEGTRFLVLRDNHSATTPFNQVLWLDDLMVYLQVCMIYIPAIVKVVILAHCWFSSLKFCARWYRVLDVPKSKKRRLK